MNRDRVKWALRIHLDRVEVANRLVHLVGPDGKPIPAHEVAARRARVEQAQFLQLLSRWFHRRPGVWGMRARKSDGVIFYGPHFD